MQKFFCDLCSNECNGTATKRWEHIHGDLGLEIIPLQGANPIINMHICDKCIFEMLKTLVERNLGFHVEPEVKIVKNDSIDRMIARRKAKKEQEDKASKLANSSQETDHAMLDSRVFVSRFTA